MFSLSGLESMEFTCQFGYNSLGATGTIWWNTSFHRFLWFAYICSVSDPTLSIINIANPNTSKSCYISASSALIPFLYYKLITKMTHFFFVMQLYPYRYDWLFRFVWRSLGINSVYTSGIPHVSYKGCSLCRVPKLSMPHHIIVVCYPNHYYVSTGLKATEQSTLELDY